MVFGSGNDDDDDDYDVKKKTQHVQHAPAPTDTGSVMYGDNPYELGPNMYWDNPYDYQQYSEIPSYYPNRLDTTSPIGNKMDWHPVTVIEPVAFYVPSLPPPQTYVWVPAIPPRHRDLRRRFKRWWHA